MNMKIELLQEYIKVNIPNSMQDNRKRKTVAYRYALIYVLYRNKRKIDDASLSSISGIFNLKHCTAIWAISRVRDWIKYKHIYELEYAIFLEVYSQIIGLIKSQNVNN